MNILVCVKQVPEPETEAHIDPSGQWVKMGGGSNLRMNRFDECAVEAAVQIKERHAGTTVHIISVGPASSDAIIRRAIGMGADQGTHIVASADGFVDPSTIAYWMSRCPAAREADLIFCGTMSEDLMQGQVGPLLADRLSLPCASAVVRVDLQLKDEQVQVEREVEGGYREVVALKLPALLTIQTGINQPRYPSLSNLLRANQLSLDTRQADEMEEVSSLQKVLRMMPPRKLRDGRILKGSTTEKAEQLVTILANRSYLS